MFAADPYLGRSQSAQRLVTFEGFYLSQTYIEVSESSGMQNQVNGARR